MSIELITFVVYFVLLLGLVFFTHRKQTSDTQFVLGNRSLNFWLTALSAHSSDMSSWLFLAYPALIFSEGLFKAWAAIGLVVFMFLNWHFIAPKLRQETENWNSLTLSNFFEARFKDTKGQIRLLSAIMCIVFYTIYISAGLYGLGILALSLFQIPYSVGVTISLAIVVGYVFLGGYRTVALIDLFQGTFLLAVICGIPLFIFHRVGDWSGIMANLRNAGLSTSLFPDFSAHTFLQIFYLTFGWGLGYFGLPHILTKFMGIQRVSDMYKSKIVGVSWQTLALTAATILGLMGVTLFPQGLNDPQRVILEIVQLTLPPFVTGLTLSAILAATTNVMAAQILVVASSLSEDFYKKFFGHRHSSQQLLIVSRVGVLIVGVIAYALAMKRISTIYEMVLYAWSGLGAAFGPLVLLCLYSKRINKQGALASILVGGVTSAFWPLIAPDIDPSMLPIIPGFALSLLSGIVVSRLTRASA